MNKIKYLVLAGLLTLASSCEEYLEQAPVNIISDDLALVDRNTVESAVLGCYRFLVGGQTDQGADQDLYSNWAISMQGVLSDELVHTGSFPSVQEMDVNNVVAPNATIDDLWRGAYSGIFTCNSVLAVLENGGENLPSMNDALNQQYIGEVKFIRAALLFEVMRLWGDVPLPRTTDLAELSTISRTPSSEVAAFVTSELTEAATLLASTSLSNFRASQWAAKALNARVNLFIGNTAQAGALANDVITNGGFSLESNYASVFSNTASSETIMRFFASANAQVDLAFWFLPSALGGRFEFGPSNELVAAYEAGDARAAMVAPANAEGTVFYCTKYTDPGTGTDSPIFLRLAEMLLIRAEANLGSPQAAADVNALRIRAGLDPLPSVNSIDQILQERFVELAFEGHRWFDLRRTGRIDGVMSTINPSSWVSTDALLPIPQRELDLNSNMTQNPGY